MTLLKRFGYYFGGFSIGLVILAFFLNGKKVSCDYSPSARVKKNIRSKTLNYSDESRELIYINYLDSFSIDNIISKGSVNFSESNTKLDSCKIYIFEGDHADNQYRLTIANCDSIATLKKIELIK